MGVGLGVVAQGAFGDGVVFLGEQAGGAGGVDDLGEEVLGLGATFIILMGSIDPL